MQIILKYFSDFTPAQIKQFAALESLYNEWNSKINVISRKDIDGLYEKHVLHSLTIAAVFQFEPGMQILDIGTGGGFPGIPLAIFFPEVKFHLADSIAKKLKVVDAIAEALEINNITTQHTRVEEIKNRKFDFVVSRAVAPLKDLWKWSKPLLKTSRESGVGSPESGVKSRESETNSELRTPNSELKTLNSELPPPGLICLKGGDLSSEIFESGTRPRVMEISELFNEEYFKFKYLVYVRR
ncbi:MAG TPA: 16S rRNA (guanine(527)-N(7))-methyltransferase RsmG [Chitinophagaceae bacterium]|nr:16S rRNA (guanine(527)-N(7))-methyltransferase RsmG [Chitinophagaceae bacterium]